MIKNEKDAEKYFVGSVVSTLFLGMGLGVMMGVAAAQEVAHSNWVILDGLIFAILSFVVFYALVEKIRKAGYKVKAIKKVEDKNECR